MSGKTLGTKLKKTAAIVGIALAGLMATSKPATAFTEVDPIFDAWSTSVYAAFVEEVDNQFFAINTYLAEIYAYLSTGEGDMGTGVVGTMNKIWEEQRPYMENMTGQQSAWSRRNMLDGMAGQTVVNKLPDPRACSELPMTMGARGMAGAGSGGMRVSKGATEARLAAQGGGSKSSDVQYAADIQATHLASGYCSATDASYLDKNGNATTARGAFGCAVGDTHKMPDADARIQSVFRPAHDFADPNAVKTYGTSLTYNNGSTSPSPVGDQAKAADDAIATMIARFSPPALPKEVEQTSAGKVFLAKVKVFNSRVSPALDFLTTAKARLDASQNSVPNGSAVLADLQDFFHRLYPSSPVPQNASDAEIMRYEVLRRYADPEGTWSQALTAASGDAAKLATIQAQTQAVELYLLYNMHDRQLETNSLLSAILAQSVNPITRAELQAASSQIAK